MSDCTCNDITTTPCTSTTGCTSTNYAKCILYSGATLTGCVALTSGENLDVSLNKIVTALCALTPADLSWNTFDYSCLASYTTAQEFAEGISAAHCALVTRVSDLETPTFTLCSLFTSGAYQITPGTTTLEEILGFYAAILCNLSTGGTPTMTLTDNCFTSSAALSSLEDYIQWIIDNTCSINTALGLLITANTNKITAIQTYLGPAATIASGHDNTDCLGGGATDNVYNTIELLKSMTCSLYTTVEALPDLDNIALSWAPCLYSNTATTLATQLGRIVTRIKAQNYTFDAGDFTTTVGACGSTISLNGALAFSCSDLLSCSIHNIGDVTATADISTDTGGSLTYDFALGYYRPIKHLITVTTPTAPLAATGLNPRGAEIVTTLDGNPANLSRNFAINFREEAWLDLTSYVGTYIDATNGLNGKTPMIMKTWDGQIKFRGEFGSAAGVAGLGSAGQPLGNAGGLPIRLFSSIPALYRPVEITVIPVPLRYPSSGVGNEAYLMGMMEFDPATGHIELYVNNLDYLYTNIAGNAGTDEYSGAYTGSLQGLVINY